MGADPPNQLILATWCVQYLPLTKPGGILTTTRPSPLSRRDIGQVLRIIRVSPEYQGQTIIVHANDGHPVCLRGR